MQGSSQSPEVYLLLKERWMDKCHLGVLCHQWKGYCPSLGTKEEGKKRGQRENGERGGKGEKEVEKKEEGGDPKGTSGCQWEGQIDHKTKQCPQCSRNPSRGSCLLFCLLPPSLLPPLSVLSFTLILPPLPSPFVPRSQFLILCGVF